MAEFGGMADVRLTHGSPLASFCDRWYSAAELAGLAGMPATHSAVVRIAKRSDWVSRPRVGRGGGKEYAFAVLPVPTQAALLMRERGTNAQRVHASKPTYTDERLGALAKAYERASAGMRAVADRRVRALRAVTALVASGIGLMLARKQVAAELQRDGVRGASVASIGRWQALVDDAPPAAWAAILLPAYAGRTNTAACDAQCWDWYKGHYLTRAKPAHADTYERLKGMAQAQGWAIPSARTLARRMDAEVAQTTQVLLREGPVAAARMIPTQQRDSSVFAPGEAVNGDGLKFDKLWVRFEDGEVINTATAWFYQDIATRRQLAWRLAKTENTDLFRLATYDLTGVCSPTHVWIDNTRVAANKLMTAGASNRHRFGADPEDGLGLLLLLGMEPHFTNPDKEVGNPGAKPIERSFGIGGIHDAVRTHPRFIDRGYSKSTAVDVAELREVIAEEVARLNAKTGRRTQACAGVLSFDAAWDAGIALRPPQVLSDSQRRLLLMCREVVRADSRTGLVTLDAGRGPNGRNRYWCEHLTQYTGRKVAVHFDPDNLRADVHVYGLDGRYLFAAQHQATTAFNDTQAAREHAKFKQRRIKAQKVIADAETRMSALERASLYAASTDAPPVPAAPTRKRGGKVVQGVFQRVADPARDAVREQRTGTDDGPSSLDLLMYRMRPQKDDSFA